MSRAYSMASANHEEALEFFSIKVADGPLTSRLQKIKEGDIILVGRKPTGTLITANLIPGKRLLLLSTGTGIAPFASLIKDPDVYERLRDDHPGPWLPPGVRIGLWRTLGGKASAG